MKHSRPFILLILMLAVSPPLPAQTFVHPGGLSTQADLNRMKAKVAAGAHPWLDSWIILTNNSHAQTNYVPSPVPILQRGNGGGA